MKLRNLLIASVALFGGISCDKSDDVGSSVLPFDNIIRVSAGVAASSTRAGAETSNLVEFGMFVEPSQTSNYTYNNVKATKSGSAWSTSETMLWKNESARVLIAAYSPYNLEYTNMEHQPFGVMADQSTDANMKASDFLYARSMVTPNKTAIDNTIYYTENQTVMITLGHWLSKLFLTIELGSEFSNLGRSTNPITNVSINGTLIDTNIRLSDGNFGDPKTSEAITPFTGAYTAPATETAKGTAEYEAIIIPQTVSSSNLTISFTINNEEYTWASSSEVKFESGKSHSLKLTAGKDKVTTSAMTVGDWNEVAGDDLVTDNLK